MMEPSPQPPSESLHSDPPSGPLEKHFFCGDLSDLQGCPSRSTLFSTTPGKQNTLPGMTFLSVLIFYSTQLYWSLFLKKKKKSKISCFCLSRILSVANRTRVPYDSRERKGQGRLLVT